MPTVAPPRDTKIRAAYLLPVLALDALATALLAGGTGGVFVLAAATLHLAAVAVVWYGAGVDGSRRILAAALTATVPLLGSLIAAMALATTGRNEIARAPMEEPPRGGASLDVTDVRRLTDGLSACEALTSAGSDERSATLAMLARRGDSTSMALLRWAVAGHDPDLAVEAALAIEELNARFETRVAVCRARRQECGFDEALADGDAVAAAIHCGLADPSMLAPLVAVARACYERAEAVAPARRADIAVRRARLELDSMCPDAALAALERAGAAGAVEALADLRAEARAAAHRPLLVLASAGGEGR